MKPGYFIRRTVTMADPEPVPEPTPFPIRIVRERSPPPPPPETIQLDLPPLSSGKTRTDAFYTAWDKFLAVEPKRAKVISRAARSIEAEREAVEKTPGDGLQVKENVARSWEQAAEECRTKVKAIVEECKRLNQKYHDVIFDLEQNPGCFQSLSGRV